MGAGGCCCARGDEELDQLSMSSLNRALRSQGHRSPSKTRAESIDREWQIVSAGVEPLELERLRALHELLQDLDGHPACKEKPLHRQAQTLLRFLRGREGDVRKAEIMFRASLDWRASFGVDARVRSWRRELQDGRSQRARLVRAYATDMELGLDQAGVPIWLMRLGVCDSAGMLREVGEDTLLVNSLSRMEAMHDHIRVAMFRTGKLVGGCVQVIDVGDYGTVPNWYGRMLDGTRVGQTAFKIFDANYPETTRKIFIVRTGFVTNYLYKMIQPLVPSRTRRKMRIFGCSASEWVAELEGELQAGEELPAFLECDSPEAFARARPAGGIVPEGGDVPEELWQAVVADEVTFQDTSQEAPCAPPSPALGEPRKGQDFSRSGLTPPKRPCRQAWSFTVILVCLLASTAFSQMDRRSATAQPALLGGDHNASRPGALEVLQSAQPPPRTGREVTPASASPKRRQKAQWPESA